MPNVGINKNIFLKDQNIFVQKLLGQFSEEELAAEKKRILHCLWLAGEIQKHCCSKQWGERAVLLCSAKPEPDLYWELTFLSILTIKHVLGKQDLLIVTSYVGAPSGGSHRNGKDSQPWLSSAKCFKMPGFTQASQWPCQMSVIRYVFLSIFENLIWSHPDSKQQNQPLNPTHTLNHQETVPWTLFPALEKS